MARLLRPHVPLLIRCKVAQRQLRDRGIEFKPFAGTLTIRLGQLLDVLAEAFGCSASDMRLDHNPALAIRKKIFRNGVHVGYRPDANAPEFLIYRDKQDHHIKTNVRGDGAQFPDRVLIKREKRREKLSTRNGTALHGKLGRCRVGSGAVGQGMANKKNRSVWRSALKRKSAVRPKYRWPSRKIWGKKSPIA